MVTLNPNLRRDNHNQPFLRQAIPYNLSHQPLFYQKSKNKKYHETDFGLIFMVILNPIYDETTNPNSIPHGISSQQPLWPKLQWKQPAIQKGKEITSHRLQFFFWNE